MEKLKIADSVYTEKAVSQRISIRYPERMEIAYTLGLYLTFLQDSGYEEDNLIKKRDSIHLRVEELGINYKILSIETNSDGKVHTLTTKLLPHVEEIQRFKRLIETGKISKYAGAV